MSTTLRRFLVVASTCMVLAAPAAAQQQLGAIQGTIADQTHAVLPGVTVTVTNADTGVGPRVFQLALKYIF